MTVFPEFGDLVRVSPEGERPCDMVMVGYMRFSRFVALVQSFGEQAKQINVDFLEVLTPGFAIPEAQGYRSIYLRRYPGDLFPMAGDAELVPPVEFKGPDGNVMDEDDVVDALENIGYQIAPLPRTDMGNIEGVLPPGEDQMTAEEFADWRKRMKVSKTKAAEMIGVSRNMPAKYEAGAVEIPLVVALACAALIRGIQPWPK